MTNHLLAPAHHVKQRLSSVIMVPAPRAVDDRWRRWSRDWPVRELAPAPAGSGLKAVRGGMPDFPWWVTRSTTYDSARISVESVTSVWVRCRGWRVRHQDGGHRRPGRHSRGVHERSEGILSGWLVLPDRRLLPSRFDAHELRRALDAPAHHAGGVYASAPDRIRRTGDPPMRSLGSACVAGGPVGSNLHC